MRIFRLSRTGLRVLYTGFGCLHDTRKKEFGPALVLEGVGRPPYRRVFRSAVHDPGSAGDSCVPGGACAAGKHHQHQRPCRAGGKLRDPQSDCDHRQGGVCAAGRRSGGGKAADGAGRRAGARPPGLGRERRQGRAGRPGGGDPQRQPAGAPDVGSRRNARAAGTR